MSSFLVLHNRSKNSHIMSFVLQYRKILKLNPHGKNR